MSKSNTNRERREQLEQMRRQARAAERRRTLIVVAGCVAVALIIVAVAGGSIYQDHRQSEAAKKQRLEDIGSAVADAGCSPIQSESANGEGQHTSNPVDYKTVPPAFGPHNPTAAEGGVHIYDKSSRPDVEILVHNLEHGWTLVWYDGAVADDSAQMQVLEATAAKFDAHGQDPKYNLIIAPWTSDDGEPIPDGKHIAITHWSVHQPVYQAPTSNDPVDSFGESQYCDSFSGAVLDSFMKKYPYDDAPEGYLWHPNGT